mmetsp:Transcript_70232/g.184099  ORF Transcript_70232/g.184099 Transcript_70232/m.184099 type:complete len:265 (+) Transcript_70232:2187-2981(+)
MSHARRVLLVGSMMKRFRQLWTWRISSCRSRSLSSDVHDRTESIRPGAPSTSSRSDLDRSLLISHVSFFLKPAVLPALRSSTFLLSRKAASTLQTSPEGEEEGLSGSSRVSTRFPGRSRFTLFGWLCQPSPDKFHVELMTASSFSLSSLFSFCIKWCSCSRRARSSEKESPAVVNSRGGAESSGRGAQGFEDFEGHGISSRRGPSPCISVLRRVAAAADEALDAGRLTPLSDEGGAYPVPPMVTLLLISLTMTEGEVIGRAVPC